LGVESICCSDALGSVTVTNTACYWPGRGSPGSSIWAAR